MSSPSFPNPLVPEPMTGFTGTIGGAGGEPSLFRAGGTRFGADFWLSLLANSAAVVVLLMLGALIAVLIYGASGSIRKFGLHFLTSSNWRPEHQTTKMDANGNPVVDETGNEVETTVPGDFGALAFIYGTVVSSALALLIAVPLSLGAALFLVRIGPWLTPTFVKCGLFGILLTFLLFRFGGTIGGASTIGATFGTLLGVAGTCFLLWSAWRAEDPRVGPNPKVQWFLHIGVPAIVLLVLWDQGVSWPWCMVWTGAGRGVAGGAGAGGSQYPVISH